MIGPKTIMIGPKTMNKPTPLYINDDQSDRRGIKNGWYEVHENGKLGSGPFSNHDDCLGHISKRQTAISAYHQWTG